MLANCQSKRNALFMIIGRGLQDIGRPRQNPLDRALLCIISWQSFITLLIFDLWHINENSLLPTWSIIESWYFMIVFWNFKRVVLFSYMLWSRALKLNQHITEIFDLIWPKKIMVESSLKIDWNQKSLFFSVNNVLVTYY